MPNNFPAVDIVCPFLRDQYHRTLVCEGIELGARNILKFSTRERRDAYKACFCNDLQKYRSCHISRAAAEKYHLRDEEW